MYTLPKKVEDWTKQDCEVVLQIVSKYYKKYNVDEYYVIGSRCNGIENPGDVDMCADVKNDVITLRNLDIINNYSELLKRSIYEKRLAEFFGESTNVIIEKDCSQIYYNTIEKFPMPYFNLRTQTLYNRKIGDKFPYNIIAYDYNNHIFYMELREDGLTPDEIKYYTNKIYENLKPGIGSTISISNSDKSYMLSGPYNIINYLVKKSIHYTDLNTDSKKWIIDNSSILKTADYKTMSMTIQNGLKCTNSDLFIKLFHDCRIYENLSGF